MSSKCEMFTVAERFRTLWIHLLHSASPLFRTTKGYHVKCDNRVIEARQGFHCFSWNPSVQCGLALTRRRQDIVSPLSEEGQGAP